ncbi:MAG: TIGR02680 family protein [Solirubrobacteraceae bacterium]
MTGWPEPERERWQPLRAGLTDLFYYDQEEFRFRDGRLLLRGNNGTGKSKVLALMLPFLLDGELSPHRVEPDADPKKRMEWNLLLGGDHPNDERLGYTWLELGRRDADGGARFCTLGCGMKAVKGRGIAGHWFFVTEQRIGVDLALVDLAGVALVRDRLEAAIGSAGAVYRTARDYRRAVDETLFGLGDHRYAALVDLLIRIRQPQLSKRPNERALSDALTGSLPPLDQALIADVAEAFRELEADRSDLAAMVEAQQAADGYLRTYRHYARIATRRRAALPRQAQTAFDRIGRDLADAQSAHERARAELELSRAALAALQAEDERLHTRDRALRESPEARSARELDRAAEEARRAAVRARQARAAQIQAGERRATRSDRLTQAQAKEAAAADLLARARGAALESARAARIGAAHADQVDTVIEQVDAEELRRRGDDLADRQQRAIDHLEALLRVAADRRRALAARREQLIRLETEAAGLAEQRGAAADAAAEEGRELVGEARSRLEAAHQLRLGDPAGTLAALELWVETLDGANPLGEAVAAAGRAISAELARDQAEVDAQALASRGLAGELDAAIERLEAGGHDVPPAPHTRDPQQRADRPGAPLWQVVDFREDVPEPERAALEAALEAGGILDAWLTPDGRLLTPGTQDVLLATDGLDAGAGPSLRDVLVPAVDRADPLAASVAVETVGRVLAVIGLTESDRPVWVTRAGGFCNGILRGSWRKPAAAFIGHGAREAARRKRLAELLAEREQARRRLADLAITDRRLAGRRAELETELAAMPGDHGLRDAHTALMRLEADLARQAQLLATAGTHVRAAQVGAEAAEQSVAESAADLRLPSEEAELAAVQRSLHGLRVALAELWGKLSAWRAARAATTEAAADAADAERDLKEQLGAVASAGREEAESAERHAILRRTAGAAISELQRRLAEVAGGLRDNARLRAGADARRSAAQRDEGLEDGRRQQLTGELDQAGDRRRADVEALRRFASTGLIEVALEGIEVPDAAEEWGVTAALRLARQIEQELAEVADDDPAWQRAQRRVTDEFGVLADALRRHGNNASASMHEEGIRIEVVFRGRGISLPALASALAEEVGDRRRLLDEREREILENHLVNEVAQTLQELISDAESEVAATNRELADRPTSTGMALRLRWVVEPDGPDGLIEARERLLRQTADAWSEPDRAAVGAFLQARIAEQRSRDAGGTWVEQLTEALDYRSWHRFTVERRQAGGWRSASGPSSGGERVLAASVPLFAAASSYYASAANPHAPRLVMLDEAFAGVDDDARAKCLGLLAAFDLDVVMTSEREWGCYREVPGLAIAQLARIEDVPAVLVTHWEWDGATKSRVDRPAVVGLPVGAGPTGGEEPRLWETSTANG